MRWRLERPRRFPRWSPTADEVFYVGLYGRMMAASVSTTDDVTIRPPVAIGLDPRWTLTDLARPALES
jgi:hypothetical protein